MVVDDFEPFRRYVRRLLEGSRTFKIVGEAADGLATIRLADELKPSLILLDIGIPGLDGIEVAKRLFAGSSPPMILFVSLEHAPHVIARALSTGARGFVWKFDAGVELLPAMRAVIEGQIYLSREIQYQQQRPRG